MGDPNDSTITKRSWERSIMDCRRDSEIPFLASALVAKGFDEDNAMHALAEVGPNFEDAQAFLCNLPNYIVTVVPVLERSVDLIGVECFSMAGTLIERARLPYDGTVKDLRALRSQLMKRVEIGDVFTLSFILQDGTPLDLTDEAKSTREQLGLRCAR